jgi:hypothetical protein
MINTPILRPGAEVADVEHLFGSCKRTSEDWSLVRLKILGLCNHGLLSSNWELLNLFLPRTQFEEEIVWLISTYVNYVWNIVYIENSELKLEKFLVSSSLRTRSVESVWGGFLCWGSALEEKVFLARLL